MATELRFDEKVVVVTGAGNGLGRSHALLFASRGAKVVVNDLGGGMRGGGSGSEAADKVVEEIKAAGGEAVANYDSVEAGEKIVQTAIDTYGRIDVLVNNAGILRDVSFAKMSVEDWDLIYRVHVNGSFQMTRAAWPHMRDQNYGRIIMTASAAGIYGNFGQANYSMAKMGLVGFASTLALEGERRGVLVNTIAPIAGSRLTETVLPPEITAALKPEVVSPLVAYLCHDSCEETGGLFEVGGGFFAKLRWERSGGKTYRVGRPVAIESIQQSWGDISGFKKTDHPSDITSSMQPILANVQAGASKGGNQFIDVDEALGYEYPETTSSYDERDLAIYALGVGAASDPLDDKGLQVVYEMHSGGFKALPTYAVIPALNAILDLGKKGIQAPGLNYGFDRILHGEQYTELKRPLPRSAKLTHRTKVKDIYDKGKNALVISETRSYDESGDELMINEMTVVVRGAGGWGGDRGPSEQTATPERKADSSVTELIPTNQALLYRLSGDWNPLHADPAMAKAFGFERPILHGLCSFGYAARHVIDTYCGGDPRYFKSIKVRFAESVFPGETLVTEMWKESDTKIAFACKVKERDKVVISNAAIELYTEIPQPKPKAKAAASAPVAAAVSSEPISADVFVGIAKYIEQNSDMIGQVANIFQFKLTDPASVWTVDLKNGAGAVKSGTEPKPDCSLELTDKDFMDMCTGKADAQKLYFGGQLKISGNVMASQKLEFLKKLDPQLVVDAAKARVGAGGQVENVAPAAAQAPASADVFIAIEDYVNKHPELVEKVATIFQFKLSDPASVWTVDLKAGKGAVVAGSEPKAECTLEMAESDFLDMTSGKADAQKLYFGGQLKISGNVMASQKLAFLQKIDPAEAKAAVAAARAEGRSLGSAGAEESTAPQKPQAPNFFAKLKERLKENGGLVKEVAAAMQFHVSDPDGHWVVDMREGKGSVQEGKRDDVDTVFELTEEDLVALVADPSQARDLYQHGKLKISGDLTVAHRLGFMKKLA